MLKKENKALLEKDVAKMLEDRIVDIPETIIPNILSFMIYMVKGAFYLNQYATDSSKLFGEEVDLESLLKDRHRIVQRLSEGNSPGKNRTFYASRLKRSFSDMSDRTYQQEVQILKAQAVVATPTSRSICLERDLSQHAVRYLIRDCYFDGQEILRLNEANMELHD